MCIVLSVLNIICILMISTRLYFLNQNGVLAKRQKDKSMGFQSLPPPNIEPLPTQPSLVQPEPSMRELAAITIDDISNRLKTENSIMIEDLLKKITDLVNTLTIAPEKKNKDKPEQTLSIKIDESIVDVSNIKDLDSFEKKYDTLAPTQTTSDDNVSSDQKRLRNLLKK